MNHLSFLLNKYSNKPWNLSFIAGNPNINLSFIKNYNHHNLLLDSFYRNLNLNLNNINININYSYISANPNINIKFIKDNKYKGFDWDCLSSNPGIFPHDITNNLDLPWNWLYISANININIKFIEDNINEDWNWEYLTFNPSITIKDIEDTLHLPGYHWDMDIFWSKVNVDLEYIEKNIKNINSVNWKYLSSNPNITFDFIIKHKNQKWNWNYLSRNPAISTKNIEDTLNNKDYLWCLWDWNSISLNCNITIEFIEKYIDKINWKFLSNNKFKYNERLFYHHINKLKKIRRKVKTFKIKNWYKLYLLTKEEKFWKWYCAKGNIGRKVDIKRLNITIYKNENKKNI